MDYWASSRWKISVSTGGEIHWIEPTHPFVLVGAHPCCEVRILDKRVPDVAYIACCFIDSVEVWPVCPIAFARWGIAEPQHELLVGRSRVSMYHPAHAGWEVAAPDERTQPVSVEEPKLPEITLEWGGKPRPKQLHRRVTLLGQDHPSTLRMYGQGMRRCDHAVVAVDQWLGVIRIHPNERDAVADLVQRVSEGDPPIQIGKVGFCIGTPDSTKQPVTKRPIQQMPQFEQQQAPAQAIVPVTKPAAARDGRKTQPQIPASDTGKRPARKKPGRSPKANTNRAQAGKADQIRSKGSGAREAVKRASDPDELTSRVTDRLMSIDQAKFNKRRIVVQSLCTSAFVIAGLVLAYILFTAILPLIAELRGE